MGCEMAGVLEQQSVVEANWNSFRYRHFVESVSQTDQLTCTCFRMSRGWWVGEMGVDDQNADPQALPQNY